MLDSAVSYIINIRNSLGLRKLSAGLALGCCLNILIRGKMIHYNYYFFRIFHFRALDFRELTDRYRGGQVISEDPSAYMREAMEQVVANGTGKNAYVPGYRVGGKTATSQTLPRGSGRYISSFIGFAPADDPQVIAIAIINNPQGIYYGGQVAAPIIRQLYENILPYLGLEKTEEPEETAEPGE